MTTATKTQHEALRAMDFEQRLQWHRENAREIKSIGMYTIKVDGHTAAVGYDDSFEDMFARFLMFIARDAPPPIVGAMG